MVFAVPVEGGEHDGEDGGGVVADQAHDVPGHDVHDAPNIHGKGMNVLQLILSPRYLTKVVKIRKQLTHYSSSRALSRPLGNADCSRTWSTG